MHFFFFFQKLDWVQILVFQISYMALSSPQSPARLFNLPLSISFPLQYHDLSPHCWKGWLEWIRSEHGSIVMPRLLAGATQKKEEEKKKWLRFRRWSVRRHSPLMKCILQYLSAVRWQLSADKIVTDVVKDSAVVECEHSAQSTRAINSCLLPCLSLMGAKSVFSGGPWRK